VPSCRAAAIAVLPCRLGVPPPSYCLAILPYLVVSPLPCKVWPCGRHGREQQEKP
jgi:hypothetical protein